jgi:glycosyltransferase involved in cell wall biosynthesis
VSAVSSPSVQRPSNRADPGPEGRLKVAYVVSRFPKLTETFVLCEVLAMGREGIEVEIYPLFPQRNRVMHAEAASVIERAHFEPLLSWRIACAHAHFLRRRPRAYLGALWCLLRSTFGSPRYFAGALAIFPKVVYFARGMEEAGVDHVHAHFASHPAAAAFLIRRLVGIPFSFTAHGSDLHRDRHMLREKVAEAAFVVCVSRYNREILLAECGFEFAPKSVVIHCGVDLDLFHPPANDEEAKASGPLRLLSTGTLHEVKGQTHLIEACRLLKERGVDFRCELIGDGPDRDRLARQAEASGLGSRVRFLGECTREAVARRLREVEVFVAASVPTSDGRREGIPVALMEAAASGKPVVASALSGIPEALEHGVEGYLVPPGDPAALAEAIGRLAADPALRRRIGDAARERMAREFSLYANAGLLARRFRSEVDA